MSYTNNLSIQQTGADINTSISDHFLNKSVWTQGADNYRPIRSQKAHMGPKNWLVNLVTSMIGKFGKPYKQLAQAAQ